MRSYRFAILMFAFLSCIVCPAHAQSLSVTGISPTSGPVGSEVTITGLNFGVTQASSTVELNGTAASVLSWSDTSISAVVPSGASSGALSVTVNNETATSVTFTVLSLPSVWMDADVGSVGATGSASYAGGTFSVQGAGTWPFSSTSDALNYVYQPLTGDGTIVARIVTRGTSSTDAGVMIRETLQAGSAYAAASYNSSAYMQYRTTTGGSSTYEAVSAGLPCWLKLVRNGNTFTSYESPDGVNWTQIGSTHTISMATAVYIGLATSSNSNSTLSTTTFDNVSISTTSSSAPVITSVSATTGSIGSQVVITGSGFGSSENGSIVFLNGAPLSANLWSATTIEVTIGTGATSGPLRVSVAPSMIDSNPVVFTVTSQPLPAGWLDADVGAVGVAGSATFSNGTFTVQGAGTWPFSGAADAMHFVYQTLSGDGTIIARVASITTSAPTAGLMFRETIQANSTYAAATYHYLPYLQYRSTTGGNSTYQANPSANLPYWLKLVRSGNTFSGYSSPDGLTWTQIGNTQTITMATSVDVGFAVESASTTALAAATLDNISISTPSTPAPLITDISATTGSIGGQVLISGSGFGALQGDSVVTLNGALMTVNFWTSTEISVTVPSGATSGLMLVSVAPEMNDSNSVVFTVTSQPLPLGWLDADIGSVGLAGSATYANGAFTVNGAGTWPFGDVADAMHLVYQSLSGDGSIVARVVSRSTSSTDFGVIVRETLQPGSKYAAATYNSYTYQQYRSSTSGYSTYQALSSVNLPYWVKLIRSGDTFTSYASPDGLNWTQIGSSHTISMATSVYVGFGASSNNTSALSTVTLDNVSLSTSSSPAPAITNLSATTGAVGSQVMIDGSGFGDSQSGSVVTLNGLSLPVSLWSATAITVTIPSGATSGPLLVSVAPSMNDSNYVFFTVSSQPLPTGWLDSDIGSVGLAGSGTFSSGVFTVNGAGSWPFSATPDAMHFVYQELSGDGSIVARVVSRSTTSTTAGVMIRESLQGNSTYGSATYNSYPYQQYRLTTGGNSAYQALASVSLPYWVKVVRSGNTFSSYASPDGVTWTQIGSSQTISMATNAYIGLAVSSSSTTVLANATFDNVVVTSGTPIPTVTGISPSSGTASTSVTVYGASFGATQGTSTLTFDGTAAGSITSWADNQIVATVPTTVQTGPVVVTVSSVQSNSNVVFTAFNPTIASLSPPSAPIGSNVTINGYGFGGAPAVVSVNGVQASIISWADTSVVFRVPSGATTGPVTVTMNSVTSNSAQLTIIEALSVTSISPTAGPVGDTVTITGTGFGSTQSNSTLDFDGTIATVITWGDTSITANVPTGATSGAVDVTVADVTVAGPTFEVNQTITLTDSLANQTTYDSAMIAGRWRVVHSDGPGCSTCTLRGANTNGFDPTSGDLLSFTDPRGYTTSYSYDSDHNVTQVSQPSVSAGTPTTTYTYNDLDEVLTETDPLGHVTTNTYDPNGNLLTVTTPAPNSNTAASVTQFAYDSKGELTQITDPLGHVWTITYTSAGLVHTITDPQSHVTTYAYDSRGNRTSITDALTHVTSFAYDAGNRLTQITYPDTTTTSFGYDSRGRRTSVTDQNNKTTTYAYDDADRLTSVTDPANNVTTYGYDTESNLTSITDANNRETDFTYDAYGRVTKTTFPSNAFETYGYDADNNLTSKTDRNSNTIDYVYDALNRLTEKDYPDTTKVEYTYDLIGKLMGVTDPSGTYGFSYDNMGRLTGTTAQYSFLSGTTFTNAYSYDAASNHTGYTAPDGSTNTYSYDTLNRLTTLANSATGSFGFSYDALSRRTQMTRPNGVTTNYTYDNLSRLLSVLHQLSGSTIDGATYTVDNVGNRTAKTDDYSSVTSDYTYDALYELTQVTQGGTTTESYSYDPVGNRTASLGIPSYTTNSSNEMTANSNASYTYDSNGNTHTKTDSSGTTTYAWDYENRLTSVTLPGSAGTVTFKYDPFGRRIEKITSTTTSIFAYDGDNLIEEANGSGTEVASYTQGPNIDEHLAMLRGGTASYYQQDGLGSVTSLTSSGGSVVQTYTYDLFGNITGSSGSITNFFHYTGREFDAETNLYFYRARYYDPGAGRFLSEDKAGFAAGVNSYRYTNNNPALYIDPSGFCPQKCQSEYDQRVAVARARIKKQFGTFFYALGLPGDVLLVGCLGTGELMAACGEAVETAFGGPSILATVTFVRQYEAVMDTAKAQLQNCLQQQ